jgi:hypothetical protein
MGVAARQFLLLPVLMLRLELNKQQASSGWDAGLLTMLRSGAACLRQLQLWNSLHDLVAGTAGSRSLAAIGYWGADEPMVGEGDAVSPEGLRQLTPVLHEMLQLLAHMLLSVMQTPQPGSSSSGDASRGGSWGSTKSSGGGGSSKSSASSSGGGSSSRAGHQGSASSSAKQYKDVSPAAAATALSCVIATLLPLATQAVLAQEVSTATCDMVTSSSSSSSTAATASGTASSNPNPDTSLASAWVPLLLRLTTALEQAMRFEAKYGPSQTDLQATQFDGYGKVAGDGPNGSAAWLATFLLLTPTAHAQYGWMYRVDKGSATPSEDHPALLNWLLDNIPPDQLPAVQQRLLSVLITASKVSLSAKGSKQLAQANQAFSGMLRTALQVLQRLLPQPMGYSADAGSAQAAVSSSSQVSGTAASAASEARAATDSSIDDLGQAAVTAQALQAAGGGGGSSSSSSSGSQGSGSVIQAAAQGHDSAGSSTEDSIQEASAAAAEDDGLQGEIQLDTGNFDPAAVLAWLSLLGRCFVQASHQLTRRVQQHAAGSDVGSGPRLQDQGLRTQQHRVRDRAWVAKELQSLYDLSATDLPRCIVRVAVLLSAAAGNPEQQLPKQKQVERPALGQGPLYYEEVDKGLSVGCQELQQLRGAGQLLSEKCSSLGLGLAAVQQSTWALADAAAAAAPVFHGADMFILPSAAGLERLAARGVVALSDALLLELLLAFGLTHQQAQEAVNSPYQGVRGCPEMTALAVLHSSPAATYMQKLRVAGLALSSLPTAAACNTPSCSSV